MSDNYELIVKIKTDKPIGCVPDVVAEKLFAIEGITSVIVRLVSDYDDKED
ncbi:hypothetical protein [Vibrio parahaemolyticus]|uniref:hypothetical protein n=1 Tax=Vibrio parahaemolyticus TaxID=670 RepID=UPI00128F3507|nr:hypothetical protein [Vibrio parahaemolyticus]